MTCFCQFGMSLMLAEWSTSISAHLNTCLYCKISSVTAFLLLKENNSNPIAETVYKGFCMSLGFGAPLPVLTSLEGFCCWDQLSQYNTCWTVNSGRMIQFPLGEHLRTAHTCAVLCWNMISHIEWLHFIFIPIHSYHALKASLWENIQRLNNVQLRFSFCPYTSIDPSEVMTHAGL